jgi:RNA ligase (TIGR02306 family)
MELLYNNILIQLNEGLDISSILGVTKYEAPQPQSLDAKGALRFGIFKTDETNYQSLDELPYGKEVIISLKVDGQSGSYFCSNIENDWVETGITSRSLELKPESNNNYTRIDKKYDILNKLKDFCIKNSKSLCLRGEIFGQGVQSFSLNPHCKLPLDFAAFSVLNLNTLQYESWDYCKALCAELGIPTVKEIERCVLTPEITKKYSEDLEKIDGNYFEGVVAKGDGFSFKIISKYYDSKK